MSNTSAAESFVQRPPQQKRSRESYDRMLKAAEKLMVERGSGDFTLSEVSKVGRVSIGSIYCRFNSKEDLVYAVQADVITRVNKELMDAIQAADERSKSLSELIVNLVDNFSTAFGKHAPILRAFMYLAAVDANVREFGKSGYEQSEKAILDMLMKHSKEIPHKNPRRACESTFRIMYSVIARQLGLGTVEAQNDQSEWKVLRKDLGAMCSLYLTTKR